MRHRAALACRSPARLRRCRLLRPADTGTGEVPQSAAKLAWVASRSGLSPAAHSKEPAVS